MYKIEQNPISWEKSAKLSQSSWNQSTVKQQQQQQQQWSLN